MITWLRHEWELKLIALVLAVIIYFFTGQRITTERSFTVRLDEKDVARPSLFQVRTIQPRELNVTLSGPARLLDNLQAIRPRLEFSRSGLEDGRQTFDLTARLLQLDPRLGLRQSSSSSIQVELARILVDQQLAIDEQALEVRDLPAGLMVNRRSPNRRVVLATGPEPAIRALAGKLPLQPISLGWVSPRLDKEVVLPVDLAPSLPPEVSIRDREGLKAEVVVEPQKSDDSQSVPLRALISPESAAAYEIQTDRKDVVLTLQGPRNLMAGLTPGTLTAFIDLPDKPGNLDVRKTYPVRVVAPAWIAFKPPPEVGVTIKKVKSADTEPKSPPDTVPKPDTGAPPPKTEPLRGEAPPKVEGPAK